MEETQRIKLGDEDYIIIARESCKIPKICAENLNRRVNAINEWLGSADLRFKEWIRRDNEIMEDTRCLCGMDIKYYNVVHWKDDPSIKICLGSECIDRIKGDTLMSGVELCEACGSKKCIKYKYCGNDKCVRCKHGLRIRKKGITKGNQWLAWFCPCNNQDEKCSAIFDKEPTRRYRIHE